MVSQTITIPRKDHHFPSSKRSYSRIPDILDLPNLIQIQLNSFKWFQEEGLRELFDEISPIRDFTGARLELDMRPIRLKVERQNADDAIGWKILESVTGPGTGTLLMDAGDEITEEGFQMLLDAGVEEIFVESFRFGEPKYPASECRERDTTYSAPLYVRVRLTIKETGEIKQQKIFMGDFPIMTSNGTFIINGSERVVVSQLVRSPGVYFTLEDDITTGRQLCYAKLIPNRGAWLEFETSNKDVISVKVDRKRKIPITVLLISIGYKNVE